MKEKFNYNNLHEMFKENSSPFIALFSFGKLVAENPMKGGTMTLTAIETNRYMDDLLLASDSLDDLKKFSCDLSLLFESRGFKLQKWVANGNYKNVFSGIPKCDPGLDIRKIDLSAERMPNSKTFGLVWDVENDRLQEFSKHQKLIEVTTRCKLLGALAGQFDTLGIPTPRLLEGKLILQKVIIWVLTRMMNFRRIFSKIRVNGYM